MIVAPIEWSLNFQIRGVIISRINFILAPFESSPRPVQDFLQFPRGGELKYLGGRRKRKERFLCVKKMGWKLSNLIGALMKGSLKFSERERQFKYCYRVCD